MYDFYFIVEDCRLTQTNRNQRMKINDSTQSRHKNTFGSYDGFSLSLAFKTFNQRY